MNENVTIQFSDIIAFSFKGHTTKKQSQNQRITEAFVTLSG